MYNQFFCYVLEQKNLAHIRYQAESGIKNTKVEYKQKLWARAKNKKIQLPVPIKRAKHEQVS